MRAEFQDLLIDMDKLLHGDQERNLNLFDIFHHHSDLLVDDCLPRALNMFAGFILFKTAKTLAGL